MTPPRDALVSGPLRSLPALAAALVRAWWPQVVALAAAAAAVAATITGALGVGSALRGGLRDLALERLGGIEAAVVSDDVFRADLAAELGGAAAGAVPAIVAEVRAETTGPARGATRATLLACDDVAALGFPQAEAPRGETVFVNAPLAAALGIDRGAEIVVRLPPRSAVPADSPLGRRGGLAAGRRLRVSAVLPDAGLGRFALEPAAATRPLVVASLAVAQALLGREGGANVILATRRAGGADADVATGLRTRLRPRLDDLGLALEPVADGRALRLASRRLILPSEVDRAAGDVLGPRGGRPTLAFLATALGPRGTEATNASIPYSTVLGIDTAALPVGGLVDADGRPLPPPADDEIVIDRWMADDLAAQGRPVAPGDRLEVRFFAPETLYGQVVEEGAELRVSGIAAMEGAAVARDLVPDVEGVTDEASIAAWDPPFPFDRTRVRTTPPHDEDERFWQAYRATPKAFVSLATARRLAGSRFGATTAWFVPTDPGDVSAATLGPRLAAAIDPTALGVRVVPLRAEALAAARGSTPFGALFLALSSFAVIAGLLLEALLFGLLVAARRRDVGLLAAVGWPPARIARVLVTVGGGAAVAGVVVGAALGPWWATTLVAWLARAWGGAVDPGAAAAFAGRPTAADSWSGAAVAAAASLMALAWAARRAARLPPAVLLAGREDLGSTTTRGGNRALPVAAVLLATAAGCGLVARSAAASTAVGLFFAAGSAALGGFLALAWWWLAWRSDGAARTLARLARRGLGHRRGRAFAVAATVAVAQFLVVAVSAFRLGPPARPADRHAPTGGWTHVVSFAAPTSLDPTDARTREGLGLDTAGSDALAACDVALVRSSGGADASCTSLYATAGRVPILGVGPGFVTRGGFRFTAVKRPVDNPWTLLDRPTTDAGPVPAILDAATAQWALQLGGVGARFTLLDGAGRPVAFEIVALLDLSILQGFVIVAEREFETLFPTRSGYGLALVDANRALGSDGSALTVRRALDGAWIDAGPEVTAAPLRLARLQAVQNTFLTAFQALGTLGLLLGTAGVAAVQAQGVAERRQQLALLRAVGFTPMRLHGLLALETLWTVGIGLAAGTGAGWLAVRPLRSAADPDLSLAWIATTCACVLAAAVIASAVAASRHAIPERPRAE